LGHLVNLRRLDISENGITILPDSLKEARNLRELNIRKNDMETVPDWVTELPHLDLKD